MFLINQNFNTIVIDSKLNYCKEVNIPIMESLPRIINKNKKVNKYKNIDKSHKKDINNMGRIFMDPYNSRKTGIPE